MNGNSAQERRPPYYLITGFILGILISFGLTFFIIPVEYSNVPPETLNQQDKDRYRLMIAQSYQANQDLGRAMARLGLLRDNDISGELILQSRRSASKGDAQVLLSLSQSIQNPPVVVIENEEFAVSETPTDEEKEQENTITTVVPTTDAGSGKNETPDPEEGGEVLVSEDSSALFKLISQEKICDSASTGPKIMVEVLDSLSVPLVNTRITVSWSDGEDTFFTGAYPEISDGYADFEMTPEVVYVLQVGKFGKLVQDLQAPQCIDNEGKKYWGSILLKFKAP